MVGAAAWNRDPYGYREGVAAWYNIEKNKAGVARRPDEAIARVQLRDRLTLMDVVVDQLVAKEVLGMAATTPERSHGGTA